MLRVVNVRLATERVMYRFQFIAFPAPNHPDYYQSGSVTADVLVDITDRAVAEIRARQHVTKQRWDIVDLRYAIAVRERAEVKDDAGMAELYDTARREGVAGKFTRSLV